MPKYKHAHLEKCNLKSTFKFVIGLTNREGIIKLWIYIEISFSLFYYLYYENKAHFAIEDSMNHIPIWFYNTKETEIHVPIMHVILCFLGFVLAHFMRHPRGNFHHHSTYLNRPFLLRPKFQWWMIYSFIFICIHQIQIAFELI